MSKVTIIVPVYNIEKYIDQCTTSLLTQTSNNLEIILIDDGSSDKSCVICDEYAEKDNRIISIHQKNNGAASARNIGMNLISGEYFLFVDGDDWIEPGMVEALKQLIKHDKADISICQFFDDYVGVSQRHNYIEKAGILPSDNLVQEMLMHWEYIASWCKLYSSRVFKDIRWETGHCIDDEFFTYKTFILAQTVTAMRDCFYHYRQRKSGAMRNDIKRNKRLEDQIMFVTKRYEPLCSRFPRYKGKITEHLIMVLITVLRDEQIDKRIRRMAKKELAKYLILNINNADIQIEVRKTGVKYMLAMPNTSKIMQEKTVEEVSKRYYE